MLAILTGSSRDEYYVMTGQGMLAKGSLVSFVAVAVALGSLTIANPAAALTKATPAAAVSQAQMQVQQKSGSAGKSAKGSWSSAKLASVTSGDWLSGAAGDGVATGEFGDWRGTPVEIAGTWNDSKEAQVEQWTLLPDFEFGAWQSSLDVAIGAIYRNQGESWSAAAKGAYDARWTKSLTKLNSLWGTRPGTLYIRFAHEFNGNWVPWYVKGSETGSFVSAWKRFRTLQKKYFPSSKLVFCPNDGTSSSLKLDWRRAFPGAAYVDVLSVDSYNQYPFVSTAADFEAKILRTDSYGAPVGIEKHRLYAKSLGLPFAVSEWSSNSSMGDSAPYVTKFRDWVSQNAGPGAGQVLYEILFNVGNYNSGVFQMYPATAMPQASAQYITSF